MRNTYMNAAKYDDNRVPVFNYNLHPQGMYSETMKLRVIRVYIYAEMSINN